MEIPKVVFNAEDYWKAQLEAAERAAEVARANLARLAVKECDDGISHL